METPQDENEINSLEDKSTSVGADGGSLANDTAPTPLPAPASKQSFGNRIRGLASRINIYLLLFVLIIILALLVVFISLQRSRKETASNTVATQDLTQETIEQLKGSDARVGDPKQILNVESNAVFSGKVLIRDSLDVAGTIKVGSALNLPGLTVAGTSTFDILQAKSLGVAGDIQAQGQLTVQKGLTVAGGGSFGGPLSSPQITTSNLQLIGDLQISRHIDAGGGTPSKSDGSALGGGGTSSISGTDTAGTATINTGSTPPAGCFMTITFAQKFNGTPHVVITPVGSAAAALDYYVTRTAANFAICATNGAPAGQSFSFDYIAID